MTEKVLFNNGDPKMVTTARLFGYGKPDYISTVVGILREVFMIYFRNKRTGTMASSYVVMVIISGK